MENIITTAQTINDLKEQLKFHDSEIKKNQTILAAFLSNNERNLLKANHLLDLASEFLSNSLKEPIYIHGV